jgi:hypothetical protein
VSVCVDRAFVTGRLDAAVRGWDTRLVGKKGGIQGLKEKG